MDICNATSFKPDDVLGTLQRLNSANHPPSLFSLGESKKERTPPPLDKALEDAERRMMLYIKQQFKELRQLYIDAPDCTPS